MSAKEKKMLEELLRLAKESGWTPPTQDAPASAPTAEEKVILDEIASRGGPRVSQIDALDTGRKPVADLVLPILIEHLPNISNDRTRFGIYNRFITGHAHPYVVQLLDCVAREDDDTLAASSLVQAIAKAAKPSHAELLWRRFPETEHIPDADILLVRLTEFPDTHHVATEKVLESLSERKPLSPGTIKLFSTVNDSRVVEWFAKHLESQDSDLRRIARRLAARGSTLPHGFTFAKVLPDPTQAILSTELDVEDLAELLQNASSELCIQFPAGIASEELLARLPVGAWIATPLRDSLGRRTSLYLRLEDADTIELLVPAFGTSGRSGDETVH